MRYLGKINDSKDLVTKEYVDNASSGSTAIVGLSAGFVKADGSGGLSSVATVDTASIADDAITADKLGDNSVNSLAIAEQAVTASKIGTDVTYSTIGLVSDQVRGIYIGTETPSNTIGNNGDIYIKYAI